MRSGEQEPKLAEKAAEGHPAVLAQQDVGSYRPRACSRFDWWGPEISPKPAPDARRQVPLLAAARRCRRDRRRGGPPPREPRQRRRGRGPRHRRAWRPQPAGRVPSRKRPPDRTGEGRRAGSGRRRACRRRALDAATPTARRLRRSARSRDAPPIGIRPRLLAVHAGVVEEHGDVAVGVDRFVFEGVLRHSRCPVPITRRFTNKAPALGAGSETSRRRAIRQPDALTEWLVCQPAAPAARRLRAIASSTL